MLKTRIIHPELIHALARAGHGSRILITDSNYAADIFTSESATRVYLNFVPGKLLVTEIMEGVLDTLPIENAYSMLTDDNEDPEIVQDFDDLLPAGAGRIPLKRDTFYEMAKDYQTSIVIVSGDQRLFANIMLTTGFIHPDGTPEH